ncbi:TRL domain-containing protein [Helicobacter sp. MIT 01-3238]
MKATKNGGIEDISTVDFVSSEIKHIYTKRTTIVSGE